jgi:hypothetical protein
MDLGADDALEREQVDRLVLAEEASGQAVDHGPGGFQIALETGDPEG